MGVSLTMLTLHVVIVLLVNVITLRAREPLVISRFRNSGLGPGRHVQGEKFKVDGRRVNEGRFMQTTRRLKTDGNRGFGHDVHPTDKMYGWEDPKPRGRPCGDGYCKCFSGYADCSGHDGNLTYIPRLPDTIRFLNFSHNNLGSIQSEHFFSNVTGISGLSLSDNNLSYINPDAVINGPRNLTQLYLGFNYNLTYDDILVYIKTTGATLQRLDVRGGNLPDLPKDIFFKYPMPNLLGLGLFGNEFTVLNMTALTPLKKLQYISLERNNITVVIADQMPALGVLNLRRNHIWSFPKTCSGRNSLFPQLKILDLSQNRIVNLPWQRPSQTYTSNDEPGQFGRQRFTGKRVLRKKPVDPGRREPGRSEKSRLSPFQVPAHKTLRSDPVCLPTLTVLDLSSTLISVIPTETFGAKYFPTLYQLRLDSLVTLRKIEKNAFDNPKLKLLFLRFNMLFPSSPAFFDPAMFSGLSNLGYLYLGFNDFSNATGTYFRQLFAPLKSLKTLGLQRSNLDQIYDGVFDNLTSLSVLRLSSNKISMVKESTFSPATRQRLTHLDLSDNPFNCSVDLKWFCSWMKANPAVFANSSSDYKCANRNDTDVTSICSTVASHGAENQAHKVVIYRKVEMFFRFKYDGLATLPSKTDAAATMPEWVTTGSHGIWSHYMYKVAIWSASLMLILTLLALIVMVCCIRYGTRDRKTPLDARIFAERNGWKHLVEEKVVAFPAVTATEKK